jgi:murein L,D-transpeptidase YafK
MGKKILILVVVILVAVLGTVTFSQKNKPLDKSVVIDKIVVEKSKRNMYVYSKGELLKIYKISLGKSPKGDKEYEGDNRTPEGLYFINDKNPNSKFHKNLGISYPNKADIEKAKKLGKNPGGQIKIHGLNKKYSWIGKMHLIVNWTAGCIAVTNKEIDELYNAVPIGTPIEIKK